MNDDNQNSVSVCFVMPKAYPLFNSKVEAVFGGSEVDLYYLATELARDENFKVSFVVADYGQPDIETRENVELIKSVNFNRNSLLGAFEIWKALKRADAQIYMTKTPSMGVPLVSRFCRTHGRCFVYRTANQHECDGLFVREHLVLGRAFKWALRRAEVIFTQSTRDRDNLSRTFSVFPVYIANGHRLLDGCDGGRDSVVWIGRSASIKRPDLFVDLARRYSDLQFVMICQEATGDSGYSGLRRAVGEVGNLEFLPRVGFHEVGGYFQRAKVLVNTSDSEGFPNTFIQACGCGTAILSLNVNPDDFLNRYNCGRCADGDWELMVKMLGEMCEGALAEELGQNGRRYAEENHDIKKIIEEYKTIFKQLATDIQVTAD